MQPEQSPTDDSLRSWRRKAGAAKSASNRATLSVATCSGPGVDVYTHTLIRRT